MNRRSLLRAACATALLPACAAMSGLQPVNVHVVGLEPLPGEGMEVRMAVKLRVQNPNDQPIDFDGISVELDLRGMSFASGVSAEHGSVPRFGELVLTVPVSIPAVAAVRQMLGVARDMASNTPPMVDYDLHGRLGGGLLGGMHFESKGQLALPAGMAQD
jgi:hypothetical protein